MKLICKITVLLFSFTQLSEAQIITDNLKSADDLVRKVLAGGGVVISNVTYKGHSNSIGQFEGVSSNIGIAKGIVLSTGTVLNETDALNRQNGPVGPNNNPQSSSRYNNAGDTDLSSLVGGSKSYDAAVLEFDFIPEGDTVRFRYVFGSEEYPEWVNTVNNDAFGFFISGPGIVGKKNIALLPDNVTAVSINNVNANKNAKYFINNGTGYTGTPQFTDNTVVNYDGFTTVLEAVSVVQPCKSYHLKIVISDIQDDAMNSAVFLEASSLNSAPKFKIVQDIDYSPTGSSSALFEKCSNGELKVAREQNLNTTLNIPFKIYGTATAGLDYLSINPIITFLPGEDEKTIRLETLQDATTEGDETVIFRFKNPSVCVNDSVDITYTIKDQTPLLTSTIRDTTTCPNESITLTAAVLTGIPVYKYSWQGLASTNQSVSVNPAISTMYLCDVTDACGQTKKDTAFVVVPVYAPISLLPISDTIVRCPGTNLSFEVKPMNGAGKYSYLWDNGEKNKKISASIKVNSTFSVEVTDQCSNKITDNFAVNLNYPAFKAKAQNDTLVCYGQDISISGSANGGIPPYTFKWNNISGQNHDYIVMRTEKMYFSVLDSCGIIPARDTMEVKVQKPKAIFEINAPLAEPNQNIHLINLSQDANQYAWNFGNQESSFEEKPVTKYREVGVYTITLIVKDDLSCVDTVLHSIEILPPFNFYLPNAFSPDGNGLNDEFIGKSDGATSFSLIIFDKWGNEMFSTTDPSKGWDGTTKTGLNAPSDVYVVKYKIESSHRQDKIYDVLTTVTLVR